MEHLATCHENLEVAQNEPSLRGRKVPASLIVREFLLASDNQRFAIIV